MKLAVLILFLIFPLLSHGEVYRWVDENGQVHFGSVPPKIQKPYKAGVTDDDQNNKTGARQDQVKQEVKAKAQTDQTNQAEAKKNGDSLDKNMNDGGNSEKEVVEIKLKTQEEKKLEEEREKRRDERFNALIKRIKSDLGTIKKTQQETVNIEKNRMEEIEDNKEDKSDLSKGENEEAEEIVNSKLSDGNRHDVEVNKEIESVEQAVVKDNEKCGFFKSFVENYEDRVKYECPSEHCDILYKKLEKYRIKEKQYCGTDNLDVEMVDTD